MKLQFLGGARTVTGSRILFEHHHFVGMIDCGLFQGPKELREKNWIDQPELSRVQCVILTHSHIDHCGYLPRLFKNRFRGPIYCSKPAADMLPIVLMDAAVLQTEDARFATETKYSRHSPALPLFDENDARLCQEWIYGLAWGQWQKLSETLSFRLIRSGHILGSAFVQLAYIEDGRTKLLTFSGDVGGENSILLKEKENILESDFLVLESTYGDRVLPRSNRAEQLAQVVSRVCDRGGTLIIPSFAVGRAQDIVFLLYQLKKDKKIGSYPVYLDSPMAHRVTEVYLKHLAELKNFGDDSISASLREVSHPVLGPEESMALCRSTEPKIVLSASGMLQGGRVLHHLKEKLPDAKSGVLFVGFQAEETKGRLLKQGINKLRIHHKDVSVAAEIFSLEGLSAHADSAEILTWLQHFQRKPELTFLNHGEYSASRALAYRLEHELGWASEIPSPGTERSLSKREGAS